MNDEEFNIWKSKIESLSKEQLKIMHQSLRMLKKTDVSQPKSKQEIQQDIHGDWLFSGIVSALIKHNLVSSVSVPMLYKTEGYKEYLKHAENIREKLDEILGDQSKKSTRNTLAYVASCALITFCQKRNKKGITRSAGYILGESSRIIEAIEDQFPGYINANMFLFVLGRTKIPTRLRQDVENGR